jgi:indole-3-glycerol phosphate synthase
MPTDFLTKIVAHKQKEVIKAKKQVALETMITRAENRTGIRPFADALKDNNKSGLEKIKIITEIKRASPSKGLFRADLDPAQYAAAYEKGGSAALSVLTDETFFKGSLDDLQKARAACALPVLRKDFIIDEYQIYEAAAAGADAVLLIVRILSTKQLQRYLALTRKLGLDALVEVFGRDELAAATVTGAELIGINNRNLKTFVTDIGHAMQMATRLESHQTAVALSGIQIRADIEANLKAGIFNFLIGESLIRAADPVLLLKSLTGAKTSQKRF